MLHFPRPSTPRQSILSQLLITRVSFNPVYSPPRAAVWYMLLFPAIKQAAAGFLFFFSFLFNIPQRQEPSTNYRILATSCKVLKAVLWQIPSSFFFFFFFPFKPLCESMEGANLQVLCKCLVGSELFSKWQSLIENQLKDHTSRATHDLPPAGLWGANGRSVAHRLLVLSFLVPASAPEVGIRVQKLLQRWGQVWWGEVSQWWDQCRQTAGDGFWQTALHTRGRLMGLELLTKQIWSQWGRQLQEKFLLPITVKYYLQHQYDAALFFHFGPQW